MNKLRTFLAVELSMDVRSQAKTIIRKLSAVDADVRWVEPAKMHLTMKFLGDIDPLDSLEVCQALEQAVAPIPPFDVIFGGVGAFPAVDRPRTLWMGVQEGLEELAELHEAIEQAMADCGYPPEARRFHPHLTLGRVRGGRNMAALGQLVASLADAGAGGSDIDEVIVMSSELTRQGPIYTPLGHAELRGD